MWFLLWMFAIAGAFVLGYLALYLFARWFGISLGRSDHPEFPNTTFGDEPRGQRYP